MRILIVTLLLAFVQIAYCHEIEIPNKSPFVLEAFNQETHVATFSGEMEVWQIHILMEDI